MRHLKTLSFIVISLLPLLTYSQNEFITTWSVTRSNLSIELEAPTPYKYFYSVDWGDGTSSTNVQGDMIHIYVTPGNKIIKITGLFPKLQTPDIALLRSIDQWGNIKWKSMRQAFSGAMNMTYNASDEPDLRKVKDMHEMFQNCHLFNGYIERWAVDSITIMSGMFKDAIIFNQSLSSWNIDSVTTMNSMFEDALAFDQDLSSWDVSNAQYLDGIFDNCGISEENFDNTIIAWSGLTGLQSDVNLGATGVKYCQSKAARQSLIDNYNWTFVGDIPDCPFITTWKTDNPGISNTSITIPTSGTGYNYDVDWENDGVYDTIGVTGNITHEYGTAGTYQVTIKGSFPRIFFNNTGDKEKILSIDQWGDIPWMDMTTAFYGCTNLGYTAIDNPDLSNVLSVQGMFFNATSFNGDIKTWNTSNVVLFNTMFYGATAFDHDIGSWDVSSAEGMSAMLNFCGMSRANYDNTIIGWAAQPTLQNDITLGSFGLTYCDGSDDRQSLIDNYNWDILGDTIDCPVPFITTWKTDNPGVSNSTSITIPTSGSGYLYDVDWENDGIYDTVGVTGKITHDYITAGTYSVAIRGIFPQIRFSSSSSNPTDKEKIISIDQWGDIEWSSMSSAYRGCSNLGYTAIDTPNMSNVTNLLWMFNGASSFDGDIGNWNVSNVDYMYGMFVGASSFNQDIGGWDVSNVTSMSNLFSEASAFNQDISDWDVSMVSDMGSMFEGASSFDQDLGEWDVSNVTDMGSMFSGATNFQNALSDSINNWDVEQVESMESMFTNAANFNQDIGKWKTESLSEVSEMFYMATSFNQDIGAWDMSNVDDFTWMFNGASSFNQNLNEWNISNVTETESMFKNASSFNGDITSWDMDSISNLKAMFQGAAAFNQDISGWDLSSTVNLSSLLQDASSFNQDLSNWELGHIENMRYLFSGATSFDQDIGDWDISSATDMDGMLDSTNLSMLNYDNTLRKWAQGQYPTPTLQSNVPLGASGLKFCTAEGAKFQLETILNWTITGDQMNCSECTTPTINEWIGPAEGSWYTYESWSQGTIADMCDLVIIPSGKTVSVNAPFPTMCHSIDVASGGSLITIDQSELIISLGIPIEEGEALRVLETK